MASSVAWLTGATAPSRDTGFPSGTNRLTIARGVTGSTMRALQLNLCDSGIATCYSGRSVGEAAAVIRHEQPDIVTLNEVCRDDVSELQRAMSASYRGAIVASAFKAAADRPTGGPYRCLNGQQYGMGVLVLIPSPSARDRIYSGVYPIQDPTDPEERVWLCIRVASEFYACTTHTANTSTRIALAQCRYLLTSAVPTMRRAGGAYPVILGADLNLPAGHTPGVQSCLPSGYRRADDGSRQDIVASPGVVIRSRAIIDMHGTTDHQGLLVEITRVRSGSHSIIRQRKTASDTTRGKR